MGWVHAVEMVSWNRGRRESPRGEWFPLVGSYQAMHSCSVEFRHMEQMYICLDRCCTRVSRCSHTVREVYLQITLQMCHRRARWVEVRRLAFKKQLLIDLRFAQPFPDCILHI